MSTNLQIAWRFITSRKRSMTMGLLGIMFGIGFFIVTQAQTEGFQNHFKQTILGTNGSIRISERIQEIPQTLAMESGEFKIKLREGTKFSSGIEYPSILRQQLENFSNIAAISEIIEGQGRTSSGFKDNYPSQILGIRLEDHLKASDLKQQMILGNLNDFRFDKKSALIGNRMANRLLVSVGDHITIKYNGESNSYRIAGIFETGISEIDRSRILLHLTEARALFKKPNSDAIFQISLHHPDQAPQLADHIRASFQHNAISWQEREKVNFDVFKAVRVSAGITVFTIILISGLGIFNTLAMIVMEKTKEIAILRSMGYSQTDIISIFLLQGLIILVVGMILGWILGIITTYGISKIPIHIHGIFSAESFVVKWSLYHYILASILSSIVVLIASYFPARRAAKIEPGSIIRGTSS